MIRSARSLQLERRILQGQTHQSMRCSFSSVRSKSSQNEKEEFKKQPFVTAKLEPGEWDMNRTDPFFRPKPPRSKLISAEDYANRPPVGFDNEFGSFEDSMVSLSWLDQKTSRQIYQLYLDTMVMSQQKHNTTSHEYVCRVIAQKFNITPMRAAAVIQLQHAEEQMRQQHPELLCEEQAKYAEEAILQNIRDAYRAERAQPPRQAFVEDPVGAHGRGEPDETSVSWTSADDIYDLEDKIAQANVRDDERARLIIDGHVYKEDVDETKVEVEVDQTAKRLIKAKKTQAQEKIEEKDAIPYPETNCDGEKRARWKFVAKVVNTRAMKKKGRTSTSYTNNNMENTLVEHDGELRVATVQEAKQAAWRPTRSKDNEYIYEGVKSAWLERTLQGKSGVWGKAPPTKAARSVSKSSETTEHAGKVADSQKGEKSKKESSEEFPLPESEEMEEDSSDDAMDAGDDEEVEGKGGKKK